METRIYESSYRRTRVHHGRLVRLVAPARRGVSRRASARRAEVDAGGHSLKALQFIKKTFQRKKDLPQL